MEDRGTGGENDFDGVSPLLDTPSTPRRRRISPRMVVSPSRERHGAAVCVPGKSPVFFHLRKSKRAKDKPCFGRFLAVSRSIVLAAEAIRKIFRLLALAARGAPVPLSGPPSLRRALPRRGSRGCSSRACRAPRAARGLPRGLLHVQPAFRERRKGGARLSFQDNVATPVLL